jgi:hypothetical protein
VNAAAFSSVTIKSGPCVFGRSKSARIISWMCGIVVASTGNGCCQP